MDRKSFLKKAFWASIVASTAPSFLNAGKTSRNDSNIGMANKQIGYNHLPNKEEVTMKSVLHKANTRGSADHGWLKTNHTFSFANYYNPQRMNFGVLRVMNDDTIAPAKGFGTHPHDNMEIITIPLSGDLEHKDSMGNSSVIRQGDVQVMSAGTGIFHSEFNHSSSRDVSVLQIWLFPNKRNVEPRYDQMPIRDVATKNSFYQILSPNKNDQGVWIHQDAWFHLGDFEEGKTAEYTIKRKNNGVYAFVISGTVELNGKQLQSRDALGVWDTENLTMKAESNATVLLMDVPMDLE